MIGTLPSRMAGIGGLAAIALATVVWSESRPTPVAMSQPAASTKPTTIVTAISCQRLPNVPGKSMSTLLVAYPPGAYTPRHRHPGSVTAYVTKGHIRSQLDHGPIVTYGAGETWFEPPGTIHDFAENASTTEPAELLATFVADNDCGPLVIPD